MYDTLIERPLTHAATEALHAVELILFLAYYVCQKVWPNTAF